MTLANYSGYSEDDLKPIFKLMVDYLARPLEFPDDIYARKDFLQGKTISVLYYQFLTLLVIATSRDWACKHIASLSWY